MFPSLIVDKVLSMIDVKKVKIWSKIRNNTLCNVKGEIESCVKLLIKYISYSEK